jgi:hypothetical protein
MNIKLCSGFLYEFETYPFLRRSERYVVINVHVSSFKEAVVGVRL